MTYHFSVTGIGFCVGNIASHEELIETITTQKKTAKQKKIPTAQAAIEAALKYMDEKPVMMIANEMVSQDILEAFPIAQQQIIGCFGQMLQKAGMVLAEGQYDNVLILGQSTEGYAAVLLSRQPERCFAQVEIDTRDAPGEAALMDAMMRFITAVVEIRYAFKLDGSVTDGSHIWHWKDKRELVRTIDGIMVTMKEAQQVHKAVYGSKRYLFPIPFTTVNEAREKLTDLLRDAARQGLHGAMCKCVADMKANKSAENRIVLLAETYDSLKQQTEELLAKSEQLLTEGFRWKSPAGSLYIRKTTQTPKVVFMNPPGGMFNSKPFYRYVSKLYEFVEGPFNPGRSVFSGGSPNETLNRYLQEVNTSFVVMYLLDAIGIQPDYLSGASMGEVVFDLSNGAIRNSESSQPGDFDRAMNSLEATIRYVLDGRKEQEEAYFGHEVDLAKYYLKGNAEEIKHAIAKYDDVFVIIEGSPKDVLICGERSSCGKLIQEQGCIAMELDDPMYVHTPVVEKEFEKIRTELTEAGVYLDVDHLPHKLFSTYLKKNMDSTSEMFAENFAAIITKSVDYTEAVKALYAQDARVFIDLSTTQLCGGWAKTILSRHSDAQIVSIYEEKDTADYLLELCAVMLAGNVAFDFEKMYSRLFFVCDAPEAEMPEAPAAPEKAVAARQKNEVKSMAKETMPKSNIAPPAAADIQPIWQQYIANQMALNQKAYEMYLDAEDKLFAQLMAAQAGKKPAVASVTVPVVPKKNYLWDRQQVIEMTENSMASVLGEQYQEVDQYPIRARMPLPPFLFVSRIISIDAEFGVLRPSSIVAEYDVDEDCVFRMGDTQVSPLIGSEASHIAIFLIAYMGLDAMSKGTLSYRAIDSSQVTYSERHFRVGDVMRTVLKINRFVQNGSTTLLFFTFETYNGEELIAITEATGGFFTKADLASNKGIITPKKLLKKAEPREFLHFIDSTRTSYDKEQLSAFYDGHYEACFDRSDRPSLKETYYLPHDMKMIDRVTQIDYNGGMYGRGIICGEKQITPDMWPFKAHFKNDPVFPAIIMTDGVTQLGVFLFAHAGLLSKFDSTNVTMINGNCVKSKFRGQARHGYSTLRYEIHVKDVVQTEESISVYFDANIFNDGLQIIQVESYALKIFSDPN